MIRQTRLCWWCVHFRWLEGWRGTSVTPGSPAEASCSKGVWPYQRGFDENLDKFRANIHAAETCALYEPSAEVDAIQASETAPQGARQEER